MKNLADCIFTPTMAILTGVLAGILRGFLTMSELHEREAREEAAR